MSIVIDDPDLERTLRRLAADRGESVEDVVRRGVSGLSHQPAHGSRPDHNQASQRSYGPPTSEGMPDWVRELQARFRKSAVDLDSTDDELLGYDEHGLPS